MKNNTIPSQWTAQNNYRLGRWDGNVIAPNTPGTKNLEVRMVQDGREWFGEICSKPIIVNAGLYIRMALLSLVMGNNL